MIQGQTDVRADSALKGKRILVVEDEFFIADEVVNMMESIGCKVVGPVGRLKPALELAREEELDGALLDVNLGGVEVFPVCEELRRRGVPFILESGYDSSIFEPGHPSPIIPHEFRGVPHLPKPFTADQLAAAMKRVFIP